MSNYTHTHYTHIHFQFLKTLLPKHHFKTMILAVCCIFVRMLAGLALSIEYWTCDLGECIEPGSSPNLRKYRRIGRKTLGAVLE